VPTPQVIDSYIKFARTYVPDQDSASSPTTTATSAFTSLGLAATHAVPNEETHTYYDSLPSKPILIYRTHKGPQHHQKCELHTVFEHPLADLWNDGLWQDVVKAMDDHEVH
jgi:hypothetical protein